MSEWRVILESRMLLYGPFKAKRETAVSSDHLEGLTVALL